jgi:hypothetical protein
MCEWCWAQAGARVMFSGGNKMDQYYKVLDEQEALGKDAQCELVRSRFKPEIIVPPYSS